MSQITDELLPCPFCGGEAVLGYHSPMAMIGQGGDSYTAHCPNLDCLARMSPWYGDRLKVVAAWNRRSTPPVGAETGEPVAWQVRALMGRDEEDGGDYWQQSITTNPDYVKSLDPANVIRPLFAAPPRSDKANGDWANAADAIAYLTEDGELLASSESGIKRLLAETPESPYGRKTIPLFARPVSTSPAVPNTVGEDTNETVDAATLKEALAFRDRTLQRWPLSPPSPVTDAVRDVLAERKRQVEVEGWTPEHDDTHSNGELAAAAGVYALAAASQDYRWVLRGSPVNDYLSAVLKLWPWDWSWFKPKGKRQDKVKAAALLLADIEREDRAAALDIKP